MRQTEFIKLNDKQWELIQSCMEWDPPLVRGEPRTELRLVWNSILYVLCRGCRWQDIPVDRSVYATRTTAHRWLQIWQAEGVFDRTFSSIFQKALASGKIDLSQLAVDGSFSP